MTALARTADPQTAKDAARSMPVRALFMQIETALALEGDDGLTASELATLLTTPRDSVSPRMKDLVKAGTVRDSGRKRVPAGHSKAQIVWVIVWPQTNADAALAALEGL